MDRDELFVGDIYAVYEGWIQRGWKTPPMHKYGPGSLTPYQVIRTVQDRTHDNRIVREQRGKALMREVHPDTHEFRYPEKWIDIRAVIAPWGNYQAFTTLPPELGERQAEISKARAEIQQQLTEDAHSDVYGLVRLVFPDLTEEQYQHPEKRRDRWGQGSFRMPTDLSSNVTIKGYELAAALAVASGLDLSGIREFADLGREHEQITEQTNAILEERRAALQAVEDEYQAACDAAREKAEAEGKKRVHLPQRPPMPHMVARPTAPEPEPEPDEITTL